MSEEDRGRSSYLDLLITTLMEHEKSLDVAIEKLEKICEEILAISEETAPKTRKNAARKGKPEVVPSALDTVVYMKIRIDRPIEETIRLIESLKE